MTTPCPRCAIEGGFSTNVSIVCFPISSQAILMVRPRSMRVEYHVSPVVRLWYKLTWLKHAAVHTGPHLISMPPYFSGEIPMSSDRVSDSANLAGTVTHILYLADDVELVVRWDDGTIGIHNHADGPVLVERAPEVIALTQ
jgi:hypothetical protein